MMMHVQQYVFPMLFHVRKYENEKRRFGCCVYKTIGRFATGAVTQQQQHQQRSMRRTAGRLFLATATAVSAAAWWSPAVVDAFVVPAPRSVGGSLARTAVVNRRESVLNRQQQQSTPTLTRIRNNLDDTKRAATSAGTQDEDAEVVVIGSGIAG